MKNNASPHPIVPITLDTFFMLIRDSLKQGTCSKLLMTKYRGEEKNLQRVVVRPIELKMSLYCRLSIVLKTGTLLKILALPMA